ncbi:type II toxin-antitoxin system VapC family toxin [Solwaraspora sp. WMMD406]|uniref:type II toxin-antitoxin system VapC family toxin n=1 Tax=Solwaraspora sp. WMMD406 TaxID=3016095 RepID=UPI002417B865|nr:type II toxin-antitoxin system VapC family toxin [Solwaraspora sp. WMMD406]MDG4766830.1 type II toxin-antitoxin system VapC family toxin [Solwaraspora sp. WMMD406]
MMLLLDTHVVIWWFTDDPTLADDIKDQLDRDPGVHLSPISLWEIGIKQATGKLKGPDDLVERIRRSGFKELPITADHAIVAARLPMIHRDPFDRMLIAQAQHEGSTIVTRDAEIRKYEVSILPV